MMKIMFLPLLLALCALSVTHVALAQDTRAPLPSPTASSASAPSLDTLGVKDYLLGPGDELEIKFFQQPDLNTTATVDGQGNISLPFLDKPIRAGCLTDKDVAGEVKTAYEKFFQSPQVSVRVTGRYSRPPVSVYGAVRDPQRIQALRKVRLNEILSFAGGTTDKSNGTVQIVHTAPVLCPEPGEPVEPAQQSDNVTPPMNLYQLSDIVMGKPDANPYVRPGDVVMVLEAQPVYITGSVVNPQGVYLREGLTLQRALAMVGGPRKEAKASNITIYRQDPVTGKKETLIADYNAIKKQQKPDIELKPYDIVDVPEAGMLSGPRLADTFSRALLGGMGSMISGPAQYLPYRVLY